MKWVKKWLVSGDSGKDYTVSLNDKGKYGCSCPSWTRRRTEECKHISKLRDAIHKGIDEKLFKLIYVDKEYFSGFEKKRERRPRKAFVPDEALKVERQKAVNVLEAIKQEKAALAAMPVKKSWLETVRETAMWRLT